MAVLFRQPLIKKLDPFFIYMAFAGLNSFAFALIFTVSMIYQVQTVGLNPLQLVLVGTVLEATAFIFEIPTGVVADVYSRRISVMIGSVITGFGFMIEGAIPTFGAMLVAMALWGFGYTFQSGAAEAWIADEIGEERAGGAYLRSSQVGLIVGAFGIIASVILGSIHLQLAILTGAALHLLIAVFLLLFMSEEGFTPVPREERETWSAMAGTFKEGVGMMHRRPVLITILVIAILLGASSEGFDRLWTPHMLDNITLPTWNGFTPVVWFGIIDFVSLLIGVFLIELIRKRIKTDQHQAIARSLMLFQSIYIVCILVFAATGSLWIALAVYWAMRAVRGVTGPLNTAWVNQGLDPKVRATVLSMMGQADAFGQIVGGPGIGSIGNVFGVRTALAAGAIILLPTLGLYNRTIRRGDATQATI